MIDTHFTGELLGGSLVEVRMDYYSSDPLALHVEFTQHDNGRITQWEFSRDMVTAATTANEWIGDGDIQMRRATEEYGISGEEALEIAMTTPSGCAVLFLPLIDVSRFVGRTLVEMPFGDEIVATDLLATSEFADW